MSRAASKIKGFAALLFMLLAVTIAAPNSASAANGNPAYCDPEVDSLTNSDIQNEVPVIMVHGFDGKPQDWGSVNNSSDFAGKINNIPGVAVAHLFDYDTYKWVDHPDSGPKLAKTIDCVSQLSQRSGGKGKVIVVGYSMGGLVARDALSHRSTDGQRAIADETGQAITIGTPHAGIIVTPWRAVPFPLALAFLPGSPELSRLPRFPQQTVVHTIAGDVIRVYFDKQGREVKREQPFDDLLVTTISAHAARDPLISNKGDGQKNISCEKRYDRVGWRYKSHTAAPCEHGRLTKDASNGVRENTAEAIEKYVASLSSPNSVSLTIGGLTTTYDGRWTNVGYGASGPGQDGSATDTTNGAPCTNCSTTPAPTVYAFVDVVNYASWCSGPIQQCAIGSSPIAGVAPSVTIGGRTPDYSTRYYDSGYTGTSMVWCFDDEKVCVHYRRAVDTPQLEPSAALVDVFNTATWSDL